MVAATMYLNIAEEIHNCDYYEEAETSSSQKTHLGGKLLKLVAVSVGLLFILQVGLNISLRLFLNSSEDTEAFPTNTTDERDEFKRKLKVFEEYSRQGWVYFNSSFYYISSHKKSWQDSRSDCQQRGTDLVVINSKEEQEFTRHFHKHIWIGLTDRETEGRWKWVDGTPLTTSYWASKEPNSHNGREEDCGEIKLYDDENSWNDKPCDTENLWMCEKTVAF